MIRVVLVATAAAISIPVSAAPAPAAPHYHVIAQLPAGDGGWDIVSVDPVDQRVYIGRADGVTAIDLKTGKATDRIVPGQRVHAALAIPETHEVISTNGEANNATLFDGRTGKVRATIPTGKKPDAAAYDPATRTLWIMDPGSGEATVVDPVSAKVLTTVEIGGSLEFAEADGKGRMYVNVEDKNEVVVLDTKARKVVTRFPLAGCDGPSGIAYDGVAAEIVSACSNGVAIVSSPMGKEIAKLTIGKGADGAAYDPKRQLVLIPAGRDGNLTVIRLKPTPRVVEQVQTALSARTIGLDPTTGRAYLPSAKLVPPAAAGQRPTPIPGTFKVLVVAP